MHWPTNFKNPTQTKTKTYYDQSKIDLDFPVGTKVTLYTPKTQTGLSLKLTPQNKGLYTVIQKLSPLHYKVEPGRRDDQYQVVNVRRMVRYYPPPTSGM